MFVNTLTTLWIKQLITHLPHHPQEQIQKLAGQIEFMRIVQMEVNNRHLKPKPGGYFTIQSPLGKSLTASRKQHHHTAPSSTETSKHENSVIEDGHSGTYSLGGVRWAINNKWHTDCDHYDNSICLFFCYSSHANPPTQNGGGVEKVWLEARSNERKCVATESIPTTNSVSQSSLASITIDARLPVNV